MNSNSNNNEGKVGAEGRLNLGKIAVPLLHHAKSSQRAYEEAGFRRKRQGNRWYHKREAG